MKSYIAFLRGINVGGQKKISMADLKLCLEKNGFQGIKTYIQSGNLVFEALETDPKQLEAEIERSILDTFGFEVAVLVLTTEKLTEILLANPFSEAPETKSQYFVLLKNKPDMDLVNTFGAVRFENEDFSITNNCVYLYCKAGYGKAKLNNNLIERKLKVVATTRNLRTIEKMIELVNTN